MYIYINKKYADVRNSNDVIMCCVEGLLGTRSGFGWVIHNNTLRHAKTIGLDIGIEGGYRPAGGGDNEGTNQPIPNVTGAHTVTQNIIEYNGASGIQGYGASQ